MKKRILSMLLAILMVVGMLPAGGLQILAHATEDQEVFVDGTSICEAHIWNDGFCTCGGYQSAYYNEETGVYEISNAGQLYWYAQYLNETNAEIYAKLTADITIPENAPNWQPINSSYAYFDGNFKTISGLKCIGGDAQYVGLFGRENWWYEISNLHITNSYFEGSAHVGAVVAELTNGGSVTNCYVTNTTVTGDGACIGSLVGSVSMGHVINCYTDSGMLVGYCNPNYGSIENSYYLSAEETEDGGKTDAQFASGEVAFLLQAGQQPGYDYDEDGNQIELPAAEIWGQNIGADAFPVLGGQKVNYGYVSCAGDAKKVYTNAVAYSEKPEHSGEIEYTPNADGTTHSGVYSCCGDAVNVNETHTQPLAWINLGAVGHISYYPCCQSAEDVETVPHSYDEATLVCGCGEVSSDAAVIVIAGETVTGYTDAAEALKAATSRATVRLLKDVTLTESVGTDYFLNLYLCGHTLTLADGVSLESFCMRVDGSDGENSISGTVTGNTEGGLLRYPESLENITVTNAHEAGYAVLLDLKMYLEIPASGVALEGRLADVYLYDVHNYLSFPNGYQGDPISVAAYGPTWIAWCYPGGATVDWFISADENYVLWQAPGDTQNVYLRRNIAKQGIALSAIETVQGGEIPTATAADLTLDKDYTVTYYRDGTETTDLNESRGIVTVVITGMGDYAGTLELTYEVLCGHFEDPVYVNQGEDGHKAYCPGCQTAEDVEIASHSYDEATLLCACGQPHPDAVILVIVDGTSVCAFTDMDTAAGNAQNYTAEDNAVLKLLKSVDLGDKEVILSGVYTLDLNGFTVTSTVDSCGVFCVFGGPELTVCNGTIVGRNSCIQLEGGKLIVSDVIFLEADSAISVLEGEIILRQCDIQTEYGIYINSGSAAVYDSTFAADCDINCLGEGTITFFEGTEFPGGLSVSGVYLENLLSEGMAYWRRNTMILPGEGATYIWGDVTVKAACTHENSTIVYIPKDRDSHLVAHSCCGIGHTEPHSLGDEGICTICGLDPANVITINMTDSFGDGWSGNAIQVYEDGILFDTVTCNEGSTATWACAYNPEKEYEFRWVVGLYPQECSFEILFADETVFTATSVDCYGYSDGYRFYPVCQHVYDEGIVNAPECSRQGYTTYTCTLCGHSYQDDFVPSLGGHIKAEGDEGIVTAPNCVDEGYTTYTCARCGESIQDDYVAPLGHVLGEDGNCTTCGSLYTVPVYVADELITYDNMADVLGDGTIFYDPATNTLTLNGYRGGDIYSEIPLNILLLGENTIESSRNGIACNFTTGTVSISGTGSLDIISKREAVSMSWDNGILIIGGSVTLNLMTESQGIFLYGDTADLVIRDNATVIMGTDDAPMQKEGIYVRGSITGSVTITDHASITCVSNDEEGIYVSGTTESITISGNAKVYVVGDKEGLDANTITVSGGTVTAIGGVDYEGIFADDLTITGGTVTASGGDQGIEAENITITGGTVIVTGGGMFASAVDMTPGTITLGQGMAITSPEGATLGELDLTAEEEGIVLAVLNPDGTLADTVVIQAVCDHIDTDNSGRCDNCDCVMESAKPVMTGKAFSLSFEDEIRVNFYYTVSDMTYVVEQGVLVFYSDPGTADFTNADVVYDAPMYNSAKAYYGVSTAGIAAKEMGDTRYYVAYAKLDDGTYVFSNIYGYSPKQYAMNMLGKSTTSDKQKVLCVAMLNYGAAAQEYFGYNTDSLMNAELTDEQKALVIPYDKTLFTGAVEADESKLGAFAATATGFSEKTATVSLESAFSVNYYFTPNATVDRDMTLYIWTPEAYAAADTLTADNASETMTMVARSDGSYWGQVSNIAAKGLDDTFYVAGVYTDESGNTYCTGVIAYSVSQYCLNKAVDGSEMQQLAGATAMYGYYAKLYFTR